MLTTFRSTRSRRRSPRSWMSTSNVEQPRKYAIRRLRAGEDKQKLRELYESLNPAKLKQGVEAKVAS